MENNDILRRIRYSFNFSDSKMTTIFELAGFPVNRAQISIWLKKDIDPEWKELPDNMLATFLNGLIILNRGKKDGSPLVAENRLNNNIIFRKLRIALNLKDDEVLQLLKLAGLQISKHELSAFFRNPNQSQYRECKDQVLRNFLQGMRLKYRDDK